MYLIAYVMKSTFQNNYKLKNVIQLYAKNFKGAVCKKFISNNHKMDLSLDIKKSCSFTNSYITDNSSPGRILSFKK